MAGAVAVMVLAVAFVFSIFWGWWSLGRPVSLSPIETAKAFSAPQLQGNNGNANIDDLLQETGRRRIQYGEVTFVGNHPVLANDYVNLGGRSNVATRLEMASPEWVRHP
jgi:hypothetical protein